MDRRPRKRPRLGWDVAPQALKSELENLSFMYSNAQDYAKAKRRVAELYKKHEKELIEMKDYIATPKPNGYRVFIPLSNLIGDSLDAGTCCVRFKLQHAEWTYPSYSRKFDLHGEIAYCKIDGVQADVLIKEFSPRIESALLFGTFMEDETRSWLKQSYEKTVNHVEKNEKHVEKKELEVGSSNVGTGLSFG
ncbi:hypothetical protein LOK49_LG06G01168 [Camellia lanceoleosa]|uniref:Uncharacterized protein n=1 Tax=Camellia lanceoleosa TaxID=1840588 RepID=A0ACC0H8L3_9ERIC|nr:hypothetical protein LOK49_LG06G01168 [Camellia lanceoleosa]